MPLARAIATLVVIASVARARPVVVIDRLPVEHVDMRNGLHVILAPDDAASSVVVHVRYKSGAALERTIEAGYTNLLAKLMSAGSVHVKDFDARIEAAGGWANAQATHDYFAVTDSVPAHALDLVLWLEAERMAGLADGMTEAAVAAARDATVAEWRSAYVDEPYALVTRELQRALWVGEFARYGNPVLGDGYHAHVASVESVRRFARERLAPNHAILVVAGRFDRAAAKRLVERYFNWIPMRETVTG
ncbi:MAG TPA: insulinase family protein, partial [Kofleriaceae bacterium]